MNIPTIKPNESITSAQLHHLRQLRRNRFARLMFPDLQPIPSNAANDVSPIDIRLSRRPNTLSSNTTTLPATVMNRQQLTALLQEALDISRNSLHEIPDVTDIDDTTPRNDVGHDATKYFFLQSRLEKHIDREGPSDEEIRKINHV